MKEKFVNTKNVRRFQAAIERVQHKLRGIERMALVYGEAGYGKSETALQYAAHNETVMIRTVKLMSGRWILEKVVEEMGSEPAHRTKDLFEQAIDLLTAKTRPIIVDEVDYLAGDAKVIETLRDLHDIAHVPMIFIGMEGAAKKFQARYKHLYDRFVEVVEFQPLDAADTQQMVSELSEVRFDAEAIEKITKESKGRIRRILALIHRAEGRAKANQLKVIGAKDF